MSPMPAETGMIVDAFVEAARAVSVIDGYRAAGGALAEPRGRAEITGPCSHAGGTDAFSINPAGDVWNCRKCGYGGRDGLSIAAHELGFDMKVRAQFLECCSVVTGRPVPDEAEGEDAAARDARLAAIEEKRRAHAAAAAERDAARLSFRDREREKARGIFAHAVAIGDGPPAAQDYLRRRAGSVPPRTHLRIASDLTYWHGQDECGQPLALWSGPAMVAAFVDPAEEEAERLIGCHITWIDLDRAPKYRPDLGCDADGRPLPTKKMRGSKKGGLIPIAGDPGGARWLGGEGIENVVAVGHAEGWREDTFYFAAGDLGNLAGPAAKTSRFKHPHATRPDRNGKERPVMLAGPDPDPDRLDHGFPILAHVGECVLLADGDSEPVMTAAAMARARARIGLIVPGCLVPVLWPPDGFGDFADWMIGIRRQDATAGG